MWKGVIFGYILFELWSTTRNMHMCVQCCHILRFLKNNTPSHVPDQYVVLMQKGNKIGPVVWPLTPKKRLKMMIFVQRFIIFWDLKKTNSDAYVCAGLPYCEIFEKNNTPSHVRDQYVVRMQKGIKIGAVVFFLGINGVKPEICTCVCSVAIFLDFWKTIHGVTS